MPTSTRIRSVAGKIAPLVLSLFTLLPVSAAVANEDRWYDVELLIFKHTRPENFASEQWPQQWRLPGIENAVDLDKIERQYRDAFKTPETVDDFAKTFTDALQKIEGASRYKPLRYLSWRQRGLGKEAAVAVRIQAGNQYRPKTALQGPTPVDGENDDQAGGEIRFGVFEPVIGPDGYVMEHRIRRYSEVKTDAMIIGGQRTLHELSGTIQLVFSRFIHIYTDLLLLQPVDVIREQADTEQPMENRLNEPASRNPSSPSYRIEWADRLTDERTLFGFNIQSHRKMRSGELHHLDHPLLGVLIRVRQAPDDSEN